MKPIPQCVVMDETGGAVYEGSLMTYLRENAMSYENGRRVVQQLRPQEDGRMEPAFLGPAGREHMISLLDGRPSVGASPTNAKEAVNRMLQRARVQAGDLYSAGSARLAGKHQSGRPVRTQSSTTGACSEDAGLIRFAEKLGMHGPILEAEGLSAWDDEERRVHSRELDEIARRRQALLLIDAAASLLDHDEDCADAHETLHEIMEALPQ